MLLVGPARYSGYSVHGLRAHVWLGLLALAAVTGHALGLLLSNDVAVEYLKWRAPAYMHAGNVAFALMLVLSIIAIKRIRRALHANFDSFRSFHRLLSAIALVLSGWHLIGSGFLAASGHGVASGWTENWTPPLGPYWRGWLLAILLFLTTLLWWQQPDRPRPGFAVSRTSSSGDARHGLSIQLLLMLLIAGGYVLALHWSELWSASGGYEAAATKNSVGRNAQ